MTRRTLLPTQITFEGLSEQYSHQNLFFEVFEGYVFYIPQDDPLQKMGPLLFDNQGLLKRIIFSPISSGNKQTTSFDTIIWEMSTSETASYQHYDFLAKQDTTQFKLSKVLQAHPRDLALLQNAEILEYIDDVILITKAEPIDHVGPRIFQGKRL